MTEEYDGTEDLTGTVYADSYIVGGQEYEYENSWDSHYKMPDEVKEARKKERKEKRDEINKDTVKKVETESKEEPQKNQAEAPPTPVKPVKVAPQTSIDKPSYKSNDPWDTDYKTPVDVEESPKPQDEEDIGYFPDDIPEYNEPDSQGHVEETPVDMTVEAIFSQPVRGSKFNFDMHVFMVENIFIAYPDANERRVYYKSKRRNKYKKEGWNIELLDQLLGYDEFEQNWGINVMTRFQQALFGGLRGIQEADWDTVAVYGNKDIPISIIGPVETWVAASAFTHSFFNGVWDGWRLREKTLTLDLLAFYQPELNEPIEFWDWNHPYALLYATEKATAFISDILVDPLNIAAGMGLFRKAGKLLSISRKTLLNFTKTFDVWLAAKGIDTAVITGPIKKLIESMPAQIRGEDAIRLRNALIKLGEESKNRLLYLNKIMGDTRGMRELPNNGIEAVRITHVKNMVEDPVESLILSIKDQAKKTIKEIENLKESGTMMDNMTKLPRGLEYRELLELDSSPYSQLIGNMEVILSEYTKGSISKATAVKRIKELLNKTALTGFDTDALEVLAQGTDLQYADRVWQQLTPNEFDEIEKNLEIFRATGDPTWYVRAVSVLENSESVITWRTINGSGTGVQASGEMIKMADSIIPDGDTRKLILRDMFGVEKLTDLTEMEMKAYMYFATNAKKVGGKLDFEDFGHVSTGELGKTVDLVSPFAGDMVTKFFFGSPENVLEELGMHDLWLFTNSRYTTMRTQYNHYRAVVIGMRKSFADPVASGKRIFNALDSAPEEVISVAAPRMLAAMAEIKKIKTVKLPETITYVYNGVKYTENPREIIDEYRALQLLLLSDPHEREVAEQIIKIYDDLADLQRLPWSARLVNYVTHLSKDTVLNNLVDSGDIRRVGDKYYLNKPMKFGNTTRPEGTELTEELILQLEEVKTIPFELRRIIGGLNPKNLGNPFTKKQYGSQFIVRDVWSAIDAYLYPALQRGYMNDPYKAAMEIVNNPKLSNTMVARYLDWFMLSTRGLKMGLPIEIRGQKWLLESNGAWSRAGYALSSHIFLGALGAAVDSSLKNLSQGINTLAELGPVATAQGLYQLVTKAGVKILLDSGIVELSQVQELMNIIPKKGVFGSGAAETYGKITNALMWPFQKAEFINRGTTYLGARWQFLQKHANDFKGADEYAKEMVRKLQFDYTEISKPLGLQSAASAVGLQFSVYPVKQSELIMSWIKNGEEEKLTRFLVLQYKLQQFSELTDIDIRSMQANLQNLSPLKEDYQTGGLAYQPSPAFGAVGAIAGWIWFSMTEGTDPNQWQSDGGKITVQQMKRILPMLVPGGRYAKKVGDLAVALISGTGPDVSPRGIGADEDSLNLFDTYGRMYGTTWYPESDFKRTENTWQYVRKVLLGLPSYEETQGYDESKWKEKGILQNQEDRSRLYGILNELMDYEEHDPTLFKNPNAQIQDMIDQVRELSEKWGIDIVALIEREKESRAQVIAGKRPRSFLENKVVGSTRNKRDRAVGEALHALVAGEDGDYDEIVRQNSLIISTNDVRKYLKWVWVLAGGRDPLWTKEFYTLLEIVKESWPDAVPTEEELLKWRWGED